MAGGHARALHDALRPEDGENQNSAGIPPRTVRSPRAVTIVVADPLDLQTEQLRRVHTLKHLECSSEAMRLERVKAHAYAAYRSLDATAPNPWESVENIGLEQNQ